MRRLIQASLFFCFLITTFFAVLPSRVLAAELIKSCTAMSATPSTTKINQQGNIVIEITLDTPVDLNGYKNQIKLTVQKLTTNDKTDFSWDDAHMQSQSVNDTTKKITATLPNSFFSLNEIGNVTFNFKIGDVIIQNSNNQNCTTTLAVQPSDSPMEGDCIDSLRGKYVTCEGPDVYGNESGAWRYRPGFNSCDAPKLADPSACSASALSSYGTSAIICLPCVSNIEPAGEIAHGAVCSPGATGKLRCKDGRICRPSSLNQNTNLCLDNISALNQNNECIKGENECNLTRSFACSANKNSATGFACSTGPTCSVTTTKPDVGTPSSECALHFCESEGDVNPKTCVRHQYAYCPHGICVDPPPEPISNPGTPAEFALCNQTADAPKEIGTNGGPEFIKCNQCLCGHNLCTANNTDPSYPKKIWTAFGCINVAPSGIVGDFIKIAMGISGGVMLLTILAGAFLLATSAGDPKKVQEAQEMISQTIIGFLFFLFSVMILRFIVVSILKIPAF